MRCVIAGMQQNLLADIVQRVAEESGTVEVVERLSSVAEVPRVLSRKQVDVLILGVRNIALPWGDLGEREGAAKLPIIGLGDDGRRLAVYLDNASKNQILGIIAALSRCDREGGL